MCIVALCLVPVTSPAVAGPLTATAVPGGELLTQPSDACGVLTLQPGDLVAGETLTVSITGAAPSSTTTVWVQPGFLAGDRWFPGEVGRAGADNDVDDGRIDGDPATALAALSIETDAQGAGTRSLTYPDFDLTETDFLTDDTWWRTVGFGVYAQAFVVECSAGAQTVSSWAELAAGRERLAGRLTLDPRTPGDLVGTGFPADHVIFAEIAYLTEGLSITDSVWNAVYTGMLDERILATSGVDGVPPGGASTDFTVDQWFGDYPEGEYGMLLIAAPITAFTLAPPSESLDPAVVAQTGPLRTLALNAAADGDASLSPSVLGAPAGPLDVDPLRMQEWRLSVDAEGSATLSRPDGSARSSNAPPPRLAATGDDDSVALMSLATALLVGGLALGVVARRRRAD